MKTYEEIIPILERNGRARGLKINVKNPVTIQDKIAWLMVYDSTALKSKCADKVRIHEYCKEKLGEDICTPIIKVWDKVSDIDWDSLPDRFVIKCNHGSGMNIIVKDKKSLDIESAKRSLNKWMGDDFAMRVNREMHYHAIPHKVFAEEYLEDDKQTTSLFDYKFWCFNGEPKFYSINDGQGHGAINHYDLDGNYIAELSRPGYPSNPDKNYPQPKNKEKMIECAKKLSADFKFVRVDFYEVGGKMYLGELTFTPGAGLFRYEKKGYDVKVGNMLKL